MYVTYEYYKDVYYGNKLTEENFNKFISKAENIISKYTFDTVNESTLNNYPAALVEKIKKCACELAECNYDVDRINNMILPNEDGTIGIVSSKRAGEVSVSYESSKVVSSYISSKDVESRYKSILNDYLYPQNINGTYYNLLSWVRHNVCRKDNLIQLYRTK